MQGFDVHVLFMCDTANRKTRLITRPIYLASASPRRKRLLREAGVAFEHLPAVVDDSDQIRTTQSPDQWVMELAAWKAQHAARYLCDERNITRGTVLTADTMCVHNGETLGKPHSASHAREMLHAMRNASHETLTGVCLLDLATQRTHTFYDAARVTLGAISDDAIEAYVASDQWQGKAGGYNLIERQRAGWPIECEGDPTTVMGLPMRRLNALLQTETEPTPE